MTSDEQVHHLRELQGVAKDGELGYLAAAEHVDDPHLATVFSEYAKQRGSFVRDLQAEIERIGGEETESTGTFAGACSVAGWI